jgi:hypothetical protein
MHETIASPLEAWANFYIVVGSAAAGLTGLQFVVLTLIAQARGLRGNEETISAFGSPNVVHFCAALLVAAILCAPWHTMGQPAIPVMLCGVGGVFYSYVVMQRARRQTGYTPVFEDWLWHNVLPTLTYLLVLVSGGLLSRFTHGALFALGGAELLLVFIGIHNAWDTITYITFLQARLEREEDAVRARAPGADSEAPSAPPRSPAG